mgnify:CR=1 FL=1
MGAQISEIKVKIGMNGRAAGIEQFTFRVEQVEQGALPDIELRLVRIAGLFNRSNLYPEV